MTALQRHIYSWQKPAAPGSQRHTRVELCESNKQLAQTHPVVFQPSQSVRESFDFLLVILLYQ